MPTLLLNMVWMPWNLFLALVGVAFAWLFYKAKLKTLKVAYGLLWLVFVPNTIYILTDIYHFIEQWIALKNFFLRFLLTIQYSIFLPLGLITFILSIYFFDRALKTKENHHHIDVFILSLNFLISFGVVMGRIQRTNSWYIVSHPQRVIQDIEATLTSIPLMLIVVIGGIILNLLYFYLRRYLKAIHI